MNIQPFSSLQDWRHWRGWRESSAPFAIRHIARRQRGGEYTMPPHEAIREIAGLSGIRTFEALERHAGVIEKLQQHALPLPVLTLSGAADRLEVPWTSYFLHALRLPGGASGGTPLAAALMRAWCPEVAVEPNATVQVLSEQRLGRTRCGTAHCDEQHDWYIDLVLVCAGQVLAIEQKVKSPPSNWKCESCQHNNRQLEHYASELKRWADQQRWVVAKCVYLTPTERAAHESGWTEKSHDDMARVLASATRKVGPLGARVSAVAFVADLASSIGGSLSDTNEALERWRETPGDFGACARLLEALNKDQVATELLEAMHEFQ